PQLEKVVEAPRQQDVPPQPPALTPFVLDTPVPQAHFPALPAEQWPAEEPEQRRLIPPPAEPMSWELREARQAMEEGIITESPRLNRAAAGGILTLALVVLLAAFVLSFRREVGETLIRLGETLSGEDRKQVVPPQTDAAANPASEAPAATSPPTSPANT